MTERKQSRFATPCGTQAITSRARTALSAASRWNRTNGVCTTWKIGRIMSRQFYLFLRQAHSRIESAKLEAGKSPTEEILIDTIEFVIEALRILELKTRENRS